MKKILLLLLSMFLLHACSSYSLQTECKGVAIEELFEKLAGILENVEMEVVEYDVRNGILKAEKKYHHDFATGGKKDIFWEFYVDDMEIEALASFIIYFSRDNYKPHHFEMNKDIIEKIKFQFGDDILYGIDYKWFWEIKKAVETICGNKIIIQ